MPRGIPLARATTQNSAALTPQARGAMTRKANRAAAANPRSQPPIKAFEGRHSGAGKTTAKKAATTKTESAGTRTTAGKKAGSAKRNRTAAGRDAGEERLRPIARAQTLTETMANISVRAQQPTDTVRRVLQATQRVAEAHLCRGGSGRISLPYLGVQVYRAQQAARPARTLPLFGTGRTINLRKLPARAIARARVLQLMRDAALR